jgi:hypothetical protein
MAIDKIIRLSLSIINIPRLFSQRFTPLRRFTPLKAAAYCPCVNIHALMLMIRICICFHYKPARPPCQYGCRKIILAFDWDSDRNLRSDRGNEYY